MFYNLRVKGRSSIRVWTASVPATTAALFYTCSRITLYYNVLPCIKQYGYNCYAKVIAVVCVNINLNF